MSRPTREQLEEHLVELVETASAAEADAIARDLRQHGVIAVANAETAPQKHPRTGQAGYYRTFVLVHVNDRDSAVAILDELLGTEGEVPEEHICAELLAADRDMRSATAWYFEQPTLRRQTSRILIRILAVAALATIAWLVLRRPS